ncbi:hypothetical protein OIU84_026800 [Salix udensis]|uniref:Uncharacterized protein n=1 Tax=Salix udensis TaxID=889485 RepID=A0AAD6KNU1_9ROSI|nr:hypothetical protein OIU84_026800 [Salix udensis]
MLMIKYRPFPCPPPSSPTSIRSSRLRSRIRSLPPSLAIEETSPVSDTDIETDSQSVSRRLIRLRHAKSSWDDRSLRDHDRPLSKSGELDAFSYEVSQKLQQLDWIPQLILSSDALRTKETLRIMQQQVPDFLDSEVHFISSFYSIAAMDGQTADHLQQALCNYSRDGILTGVGGGCLNVLWCLHRAKTHAMLLCLKLPGNPGKRHLLQQDLAGGNFRAWVFVAVWERQRHPPTEERWKAMLCCWREKHLEQLFYKKKRNFHGSSADLTCSSFVYTVVFEMTYQMYRTVFQRPNHNPYTPPPPVSGNDSTTTHTASNEVKTLPPPPPPPPLALSFSFFESVTDTDTFSYSKKRRKTLKIGMR